MWPVSQEADEIVRNMARVKDELAEMETNFIAAQATVFNIEADMKVNREEPFAALGKRPREASWSRTNKNKRS